MYFPVFKKKEEDGSVHHFLLPYEDMIGDDYAEVAQNAMEFALLDGIVVGMQYVEILESDSDDPTAIPMANSPAKIGPWHVAVIHGPLFDQSIESSGELPPGAVLYEPPEEEKPPSGEAPDGE